MKDLVQKLPSEAQHHETGTTDETYAAVLATLNEVIRKNAEFARFIDMPNFRALCQYPFANDYHINIFRSLLDTGGIERLMHITREPRETREKPKYSVKVVKFASQVT